MQPPILNQHLHLIDQAMQCSLMIGLCSILHSLVLPGHDPAFDPVPLGHPPRPTQPPRHSIVPRPPHLLSPRRPHTALASRWIYGFIHGEIVAYADVGIEPNALAIRSMPVRVDEATLRPLKVMPRETVGHSTETKRLRGIERLCLKCYCPVPA